MNIRQRTLAILILATSLAASGCGPGQLFGPTVTPSATPTPAPTATPLATPTSTPVPVGAVLEANGFTLSVGQTCSEGPCKNYYNTDLFMIVTIFDNGNFVMERFLVTADINKKQGPVYLKIIDSLYPADVADAILGREAGSSGSMKKLPYEGKIGGYSYNVYSTHSDRIGSDELVVLVNPIP